MMIRFKKYDRACPKPKNCHWRFNWLSPLSYPLIHTAVSCMRASSRTTQKREMESWNRIDLRFAVWFALYCIAGFDSIPNICKRKAGSMMLDRNLLPGMSAGGMSAAGVAYRIFWWIVAIQCRRNLCLLQWLCYNTEIQRVHIVSTGLESIPFHMRVQLKALDHTVLIVITPIVYVKLQF